MIVRLPYFLITTIFIFSLFSCSTDSDIQPTGYFNLIPSLQTGIEFSNNLTYDRNFNIYTYRNFYNGGGVAIGDINNDGFSDVYMTSNLGKNKLFLNKGNWKFEDISLSAKVGGESAWSTGVSMVDINGDSWLDIYVCNSGDVDGDNKKNELFINQKDGTFIESAAQYGLDDAGYSTHAAFFDFDKDGDLDMYLLNNSYRAIGSFNPRINIRKKRDVKGGDKLFRNDNAKFADVSEAAGIYGSEIGFGLGVTVGDIDHDGWEDIYISNDFFEKDYIYMNQKNGTFKEDLESQMLSISVASMGADMADLNNDGNAEIFVTEMLPSDPRRIKTKTTFEDWDKYMANIENGYYHQFTRNMLHLNNGDKTFSEVGRYAGVEASDWSWGALLADFDNDGLRDIFVANGINKDLTDQDFINYLGSEETKKKMTIGNKVNYKELIDVIPSEKIPNRLFINQGKLQFEDLAKKYGVDQVSHSNGSAYGDLDNDGDLDLIVNNVNMESFVYQNNTPKQNYIQFQFKGKDLNSFAIGTKVYLYKGTSVFYDQFMPTKGFQSSMDYVMHFGLGDLSELDSVKVIWPSGEEILLDNYSLNTRNLLEEGGSGIGLVGSNGFLGMKGSRQVFKDVSGSMGIDFKHEENKFVDFDRNRLLFHMMTTEGPKVAIGDLNKDGKDDFFICGAKDQASAIFLYNNGGYKKTNQKLLTEYQESENQDVAFVDLDKDGDLDIYVCSGGPEFNNQSSGIRDRAYTNDGNGNFTLSKQRILPAGFVHTGAIDVVDKENNGKIDLLISERIRTFQYGIPCDAFLLEYQDTKAFENQSSSHAPELKNAGMYTDVKWADLDQDGTYEFITCGKYMPISIYKDNGRGKWENTSASLGLSDTEGWWNTIETIDIDKDGDLDILVGNHGTNSRFPASIKNPLCLHINDFDQNRSIEHILCTTEGDVSYPMALRHDLFKQLPGLKKKFLKYEDYALKSIEEIFTEEERAKMLTLYVKEMETCLYINEGTKFIKKELPISVQFAPTYAIKAEDFDKDGNIDIVLGGNLFEAKPEVGRYDASRGTYLAGQDNGTFKLIKPSESGFEVEGQIRDIQSIRINEKAHLLVTRNNDSPKIFAIN